MNKTTIKLYYFFLLCVSLGMITYTVSIGSRHVTYGQEISQLEKQHNQLIEKKHMLTQQITQAQSMASLEQVAKDQGYVAIQKVLRLQDTHTVASR